MIRVPFENLVPGRRYRITRPGINDEYNQTRTFIGYQQTPGASHAQFRLNTGGTSSLRQNNGWTYNSNINDEIMRRNGALANEHANFRAELREQLGAEEAARRLANPRGQLALHRRGPLLKHFYNTRKRAQNKAKKNSNTTKGGRRTRRRR